jgi:hypothetical protein
MYYRQNDKVVSLDGKSKEDKVENFTYTAKKPIQWYEWIVIVFFGFGVLVILAQIIAEAFGFDLNTMKMKKK